MTGINRKNNERNIVGHFEEDGSCCADDRN